MNCLKCGAELSADASECPRCGVLVAKARTRSSLDDSVATKSPLAVLPASAPTPPKPPYGVVTETMIDSLDNTRSWVRVIVFSSALAFLFLATAGTFAYFTIDALGAKLDNRTLISFAAALAISAFSFLLLKDYANAIERIRGDQPTRALEDAIAAQEKIWRVQGALTLLGWLLALFLFALSRLG
ncbi:MAG TPA: hypothetical protein VN851_27035 [Thermoanaerobaculia bacterium]|nr:hypothetical protein [Thermoanaerobaculia bacterium]